MAAVMYRHTSTVSLVSQSSVQFEAGLLVQCLNKYKESLECGCERVLESLCSKLSNNDSTNLNYCAASSGKSSPNLLISRSPSRTGCNNTPSPSIRRLDPRARESLGQHLIELLATLVLPEPPQSIGEVDSRLSDGLPSIPDKLMPTETDMERYRTLAEKGRKKGLRLPVDKIYLALKDFNGRFSHSVCIYIVAVAEHIIGNFLQAAICYEEKALTENIIRASTVETLFILYRDRIRTRRKAFEHRLTSRFPQDYDKCVDELDNFLHASLEQMNLLLRVFREPVLSVSNFDQTDEDNINVIFGSILDLYNNMRIFLDTVDSEEEDSYVTGAPKSSFIAPTILSDTVQSTVTRDPSPILFNTSTLALGDSNANIKPADDIDEHSPSRSISFASITRSGPAPSTQRHRLVGVCLLELAEDDSLHAFSQYATTVLDSLSRDRAWNLCETGHLITVLCRLSRTILHTTSLNKVSSNPAGNCSGIVDPRLTDIHSFTCTRCRYWDTVMTTPRRRSTSSNAIRLTNDASSCLDSNSTLLSKSTAQRWHRASHSTSACETPPGAVECNFLVNAFKYLLPRLLLLPIFQFFYLHELIETLHRCAYDDEECGRLIEVLSMLRKTRLSLERDLSKHSWVCLHLARLISTGHLVGRYLPFYLDMLAGSACPPSPINSSGSHTTPPSPTINISSSLCSPGYTSSTSGSNGAQQPCANTVSSGNFTFPTSSVEVPGCGQPGKAEEIERLLGGKEKLLTPNCNRTELGDFVMEGRVHLRTESKRSSTEHIAYLFTGLLVICKWQERRATLNPGLNQFSVLRIKHRIPLNAIHVIDVPPVVQPNLPAYVGNSGTVTSSAVGAAVLAAASAAACGTSAHHDDCSNFSSSGMNGSVMGHSSLIGSGGSGCANYPYSFELEFVDPSQFTNTSSPVASTHRGDPFPHVRHTSPQKPLCSLSPADLARGDSPNVSGSTSTAGCTDPNCPTGLSVHHIWLSLRTLEEKADWMASLLSIQLHRLFLRYIRTLPKIEVPLRLPSPSNYRFAQPDTPENIIFETSIPTETTAPPEPRTSMDSSDDGIDEDTCLPLESEDYEPSSSTLDVYKTSGVQLNQAADDESRDGSHLETTSQNLTDTKTDDLDENDMATLTSANSSDVLKTFVTKSSNHATTPANTLPGKVRVSSGFQPQIRMATLEKLIERMTYPSYFDARLVNTFLLVYRRVTTPEVFLDMLIERFRIPDPEFLPVEWEVDTEHGQLESPAQHMLKRFRSGYKKRVQARVIMVLSRWVRSSRYYQNDFAPRPDLCRRLVEFLSTIQARHLQCAVRRIVHHLQTASVDVDTGGYQSGTDSSVTTVSANNTIHRSESLSKESHLCSPEEVQNSPLLNLNLIHPYKLAEQVTLYEWELYRRIQFWEVDGRDRSGCPTVNLDKSKSFSNRFRNWLVYAILSEPHPDDRAVAIQRVIDLMLIMEQMNNLQGSQEAKSALISAAVFRLRKAFQSIRKLRHYRQVVDRIRREATVGPKPSHSSTSSQENNFVTPINGPNLFGPGLPFSTKASRAHERRIKDLEKRQASGEATNPCVPFIAAGVMTRLIHLDVLHSDTVTTESGTVLINCWKHRQLAEVVERYLAFQRVPYEFTADPETRVMLEQLDPLTLVGVSSESEFERRMYELSESYEPRESEASGDTTSNVPTAEPERHMSKEEIHAANLLSSVSLKERMSPQSVYNFSAALSSNISGSIFGSSASRIFTPSSTIGFRSSRKGLKSPQSVSPPLHGKPSRSQDRDGSGKQQKHRYLRIPPSSPLGGSSGCHNDALPPAPGSHQHSMSDSHVFKLKRRTTPHHQTMHSIGTPGVSNATTTSGLDLRCLASPSPPFSSSHASSSLISSPTTTTTPETLPPPLPPRKSGQATSGSSTTRLRKCHSPLPLLIAPPPPTVPSPPGLSPYHHNQNNGNNNLPWISSDVVVDNPIYFPQVSPTPPPLPPKFGSSRTSMRASSSSASSSPHHQTHHLPQASSNGQAFVFGPDMGAFIRDVPPPLPPRKPAVTTPPASSVVSRPGSVSNERSNPTQLHVTR